MCRHRPGEPLRKHWCPKRNSLIYTRFIDQNRKDWKKKFIQLASSSPHKIQVNINTFVLLKYKQNNGIAIFDHFAAFLRVNSMHQIIYQSNPFDDVMFKEVIDFIYSRLLFFILASNECITGVLHWHDFSK